MTWPELSS